MFLYGYVSGKKFLAVLNWIRGLTRAETLVCKVVATRIVANQEKGVNAQMLFTRSLVWLSHEETMKLRNTEQVEWKLDGDGGGNVLYDAMPVGNTTTHKCHGGSRISN